MNKKIIIIGLLILPLIGLTACTKEPDNLTQHPLIQAINNQFAVKRDVEIYAVAERKGKEVTVTLTLHNLSQKPITSVQSWLSYNPRHLKGIAIKTDASPFTLTAPYESNFDGKNGLVRLGRATNKPITDARIEVAQVTFEALTDDLAMISFYDYQQYLTGHTSVNMMQDNVPYNVLKQPKFPAVVVR